MKKIDMKEAFDTLPEIPEYFKKYCKNRLSKMPIFYKRMGKYTDCNCGKCGKVFVSDMKPIRHNLGKCPICGHMGKWEWTTVTREHYETEDIVLIQCTTDKNAVIRIFTVHQKWQQGYVGEIDVKERRRYFLHMGDVYKFYNANTYGSNGWERKWGTYSDHEIIETKELYPGWKSEILRSNLKYYPFEVAEEKGTVNALIAYANNPALEMYAKTGMKELVSHLIHKEGKTSLVNRRAKTPLAQLRLKDKAAFNRLVKAEGEYYFLQVLQLEKKTGSVYTPEQEAFLAHQYRFYRGREKIEFLLQYMTLQKLMNRIEKYKDENYRTQNMVVDTYCDYLEMRRDLGYDMTNEVYLYPKNLKQKHDQMVAEQNAKRDERHIAKKLVEYPNIAESFEKLCKLYAFEDERYVIRPAKDAGEIIVEGRTLHHCVGGDRYLSKHNTGQTVILFLRKTETPDIPYYTIEIRGSEILQWYGEKDKKPDKELVGPWLDNYVGILENGTLRKTQELLMAAV